MSIASQITTMQEHIEDIYDTFAVAGVDTSVAAKNIVNINANLKERLEYYLANGLDVVWNNWNKITGSGETITLNNTIEAKMDVVYKGNTSQFSTQGYSLYDFLNNEYFTESQLTVEKLSNGFKLTNSDTSAQHRILFNNVSVDSSKNYVVSFEIDNPSGQNVVVGWAGAPQVLNITKKSGKVTGVLTGITSPYFSLYCNKSSTVTFTNIMIYEGTDTTKEYEKYTGGNPAPNPDYPQDIQVVSGDNEIDICGKNLLDTSSMVMGDLPNDTGNEVANTNHTHYRSDFIKVLPNTQYTFTTDYTYSSTGVTKLMEYANDKSFIRRNRASSTNKVITFTTNSNTNYLRIVMYSNTAFTDFYSLKNMVVKGSETTYEPYQSQTYPISLDYTNLFKKQDISSDDLNQRLNQIGEDYNENGYFISPFIKVDKDTQYTINYTPTAYTRICYYASNNTNSFISKNDDTSSFTTPSTCQYLRFCNLMADIDNIRLEKGSTITNNYIELCKIGTYQDRIFKSSGKNLLNISDITSGNGITNNGDGTITLNGTITNTSFTLTNPITLKANKTYTLSLTNTYSNGSNSTFILRNGSTNIMTVYFKNKSSNAPFTPTQDTIIDTLRIFGDGVNFSNYTFSIQLEENNQYTSYEPYGKVWYIHKDIGKVVLDGSETYFYSSYSDVSSCYRIRINITDKRTTSVDSLKSILLSNYFKAGIWNGGTAQGESVVECGGNYETFFIINKNKLEDISTNEKVVQSFKTWLSTHNTTVYYVLETPTTTEITDSTLIEQLDNLENAYSYDTQTNISQTNADKPFILDVTALKDLDAEDTTPTLTTNRGLLFTQPPVSENFINDEDDNSILEETINEEEPNIEDNNREEEEPLDFFEKEIINNDEEQEEIPTEPIEIDNGQR